MTTPKDAAAAAVAASRDELVAISHDIHARPELSFEEVYAAERCAAALADAGFAVTAGICDLPTAFSAEIGTGPLTVAVCCEYDALPGIGHACGHNIIAAAAVGAGIGLAEIADELGVTVRVLGTPAEEGGGGKILMLERGGFDGVHAAMMVHPWTAELLGLPCLAVTHFDVHYHGTEAHASAYPERGRNAADAITVAQVALGLLRQHANPGDQVHGIVTHGGDAPNIVPAHAVAKYYVRAASLDRLSEWMPRVERCFEAGALATGTDVDFVRHSPPYSEFVVDEPMARAYRANAEALGRRFSDEPSPPASTDMANVSLVIPSIHPTLDIGAAPAVNHQAAYAAHCVGGAADRAVLDGATAMAMTVCDLATSERGRFAHAYDHRA